MRELGFDSVMYDADYARRLANSYDELMKKSNELSTQVKNLTFKLKENEEYESHLRRDIETQMTAHNETRRKYAEALKELIELREKLAGKVGAE